LHCAREIPITSLCRCTLPPPRSSLRALFRRFSSVGPSERILSTAPTKRSIQKPVLTPRAGRCPRCPGRLTPCPGRPKPCPGRPKPCPGWPKPCPGWPKPCPGWPKPCPDGVCDFSKHCSFRKAELSF
jgi:hypothetical protein